MLRVTWTATVELTDLIKSCRGTRPRVGGTSDGDWAT